MSQYKHIEGVEGLQARLLQLPAKLEQKILRGALRAGAVVIKRAADAEVPRRSGKLARTLRVSTKSRRGLVTASIKAGDKNRAWYAHIVEGGAKPHPIRAKRFPFLRLHGNVFVRKVSHPGARPNRFMKRALDRGVTPAIAAVADYIRGRLDKIVK
ncbi:MAG: HK97 gp10 family phage protein [Sulfuricaulis sp.]|nr:HK97 gp10 family phage protein [Sulfuricaulis sp.]